MKIFDSSNYIVEFSPSLKPNYNIKPGEEFIVNTMDCFSEQITDEETYWSHIDASLANAATGPFEVEGAEVGDLLKIEILDIEVAPKGTMLLVPGFGVLGSNVKEEGCKKIEVKNNTLDFSGIKLEAKPMIGVIGVATKSEAIPTVTPGAHGGNMDTKDITKGSTLYLNVNQKGSMLALGDIHALMGDGELSCTGLEIGAKVKLKVDVIKNKSLEWPLLKTKDEIMTLASAKTVEEAIPLATEQMMKLLEEKYNLPWGEIYMLSSLIMDLRISQVVNELVTVKAVVSKEHIDIE